MNPAEDQTSSVPDSWMMKTIGDLASYVRGVTYDKSLSRTSPAKGYTPLLRATNIDSGALILEDFVYVPEDIVKAEQLLQIGDLVIAASSGSSSVVGKSAPIVTDFSGTFGAFCAVLRADLAISNKYLGYYIQSASVRELWSSLARGTNINNLKRDQVCSTPIAVPPRNEQDEIVRILEEQFSRLDAAAASIAAVRRKADQFRRSLAYAVFGGHFAGPEMSPNENYREWQNVQLGDLLDDVQPGFASGRHNADGRGVIHVRPMNISRLGRLDLVETKHVEVSDGHRLQRGDVLFNNTNSPALVGKTALIDSDDELAFSNHMTRLRVKLDLIWPEFLALRLHALWHEGFFQEICSNHVNQASVSSKRLKQVEILLPPLEQQSEIVDLMNIGFGRVDRGLHNATSAERSLSATRRSLLQAAFTGELTKEWREKNNG